MFQSKVRVEVSEFHVVTMYLRELMVGCSPSMMTGAAPLMCLLTPASTSTASVCCSTGHVAPAVSFAFISTSVTTFSVSCSTQRVSVPNESSSAVGGSSTSG